MNNYYVYLHTRNDTFEPFYIGKGKDSRAYVKSHKTAYWKNIVKKYGYSVTFLAKDLSEDLALRLEIFWIKTFGRYDLKEGTLVNLTDGGEATLGYKHTDKAKNEMSISRANRKNSEFQKKVVGNRYKGKFGSNHNRSKSVKCLETGFVYGSQMEAQRDLNLGNGAISWAIKHKKPIFGMHFEIKE